ncbi:hypothetical protein SLA2020_480320 [Shorea laevis]
MAPTEPETKQKLLAKSTGEMLVADVEVGAGERAVHDGSRCVDQSNSLMPPYALNECDLISSNSMITTSRSSEPSPPPTVTLVQESSPFNAMVTNLEAHLSDQSLETSGNLDPQLIGPSPLLTNPIKYGPAKIIKDPDVGSLLSAQVESQLSLGSPASTGKKRKSEHGPFEEIFKRACVKTNMAYGPQCSPTQLQEALAMGQSEFHIQDQ